MVSIVDVVELKCSVLIGEQTVDVLGITAEDFGNILYRFPEVKMLFAGRVQEITAERLFKIGPEFIKVFIAAGCGALNDPKAEAKAAKLVVGYQMDLIHAIIQISLPHGPGPFFEKLTELIPKDILERAGEEFGKAAVTNLPKRLQA